MNPKSTESPCLRGDLLRIVVRMGRVQVLPGIDPQVKSSTKVQCLVV